MNEKERNHIEHSIHFEPLHKAEKEELLDLISSCLSSEGATYKSKEFWSWKHEIGPFGASVGCIARDAIDGSLIAIRPLMKWSFKNVKSEVVHAVRPVDTVTHPQWRGRGIFSKLTRAALADLPRGSTALVFNTPNQNSLPGYEKMGWIQASKLDILIRPGRISCLLRSAWRRFQKAPRTIEWYELAPSHVLSTKMLEQEDLNYILSFCVNAEDKRAPRGLRTCRTLPYLRWRYFEQPNADYGVFIDRSSNGDICSVSFLRCEQRAGFNVVLILDVFSSLDDRKKLTAIFKSLRRLVNADFFAFHATPSSNERNAAIANFFIPIKKKVLAARCVDVQTPLCRSPIGDNAWDLTLADIEIF